MKNRFFQVFISFLTLALISTSCVFLGPSVKGNGKVEQQNREVEDFSKIKTSNGIEVHLIPDEKEYVVVEADNNLFNVIETELDGDVLRIYTHERIRWAASKKVFVHYLKVEEIKSSSGSMLYTDGTLNSKSLACSASSGSQQKIEVNASRLNAKCSSGSHIQIKGKCHDANIKASSGSHFKGGDLTTKICRADVSSGAHITIKVEEELDGEASSGGHIYYSGNPAQTDVSTSSGGQIRSQ